MLRLAVPKFKGISVRYCVRAYHSYPEPGEKPEIRTTTAPAGIKQLDKTSNELKLHDKFRLDKPFPDMPAVKPLISSATPPTLSTKLDNGLTVATQEMPGLMSSVAFIVKAGRLVIVNVVMRIFIL
ncbi:hypothetical protein EON65_00975 [archaeon]|nr:MAG: hypothetical protein EON65_00975 [archaeon]